MYNTEHVGFVPDLRAAWQNASSKLGDDVDSLVLVAFRVLVLHLEQHGFFHQPPSAEIRRDKSELPLHLIFLLRGKNSKARARYLPGFIDFVTALLDARRLNQAAKLASAIDEHFGRALSSNLKPRHDLTVSQGLQAVTHAVNAANRLLTGDLLGSRPIILVRPEERYWAKREGVVPDFPLSPQRIAKNFFHLLPTETRLKRVHYSALEGMSPKRLVVALWPLKAPLLSSSVINKMPETNGRVHFYFKSWNDLPEDDQKDQISFAKLIAGYIRDETLDAADTVHVVAAPELTLAPESLEPIITAVEDRTHAAWIVFPGSYHIETERGIINQAPIYVGGALSQKATSGTVLHAGTAAVKQTPFVLPEHASTYVEDIERSGSLTHLLDTSIGRIAVMICADFIEENLRNEVISMCVDHLFVLSMSPDRGPKFAGAMDAASNYRTSCFYVNAFTSDSRRAAHRVPLRKEEVIWMPSNSQHRHYSLILEPE